ncbi:MAG: LamG domain-containing protein, partial [Planctomycetota bacterium]
MCKKIVLLTSFVLVVVMSGAASADLVVPADTTHILDSNLTDAGDVQVAGHLIVNAGNILFESRSTINGPNNVGTGGTRPEITVNGGNFDVNDRLDMGETLDAYLTINDGNFTVGGHLKLPNSAGGTHRIWLNGGTLRAYALQLIADRDAQIIVGGGVLELEDIPTTSTGSYDPSDWLTAINPAIGEPALVPAEGFAEVVITYDVPVAGGAQVSAIAGGPYAENPYPARTATGVCPDGVVLSWKPTDLIVDPNHDVYLDPNRDDVEQATRDTNETVLYYSENQDSNEYSVPASLQLNTTYYWRVDEVNNADPCVWESPIIWSFTTESPVASNPNPPDNASGYSPSLITALTWKPSCAADTHKVYLGKDLQDGFGLMRDTFEGPGGIDMDEWDYIDGWELVNAHGDAHYGRDSNIVEADGTGEILESNAVDLSDACAFNVRFDVNLTKGLSPSAELQLLYWNGSSFIEVADWNYVDANDHNNTWFVFSRTLTRDEAPQYMIDGFKFQLKTVNLDKPVYIDTPRIRNTWPAAAKWYLGTEDSNSFAIAPEPLSTYGWRIDTVVDGNTYEGPHWTFSTWRDNRGLLLQYYFDGTEGNPFGATVTDSTGNFTFTHRPDPCDINRKVRYGPPNPIHNSDGTSADFDPNAGLYRLDPCGPGQKIDLLRLACSAYTVEFWVKPELVGEGDCMLVGKSGGPDTDPWRIFINDFGPGWDNELRWVHDDDNMDYEPVPQLVALAETGECEWFHVAAVYNRDLVDDDESQRLYVNGAVVADGGHSGMNPSDNDDPVGIGLWYMADGSIGEDMPFIGKIDELRIMDIALGPAEFLLTPGPEWASNPRPVNGVRELDPNDPNLALVWDPGTKVAQHKVYFSTNYTDVCEGNPAALMATLPAESNSWPTDGNLADYLVPGTWYYWRIDEVNGGQTWSWVGLPSEFFPWMFETRYEITDPHLKVWYRLDEESGDDAWDTSGHGTHGDVTAGGDPPAWEPLGGKFGGCLVFDNDTRIDPQPYVLPSPVDNNGVTVAVWLNGLTTQTPAKDMWVLDGGTSTYRLNVIVPDAEGRVIWRAGNDSNDYLEWEVDTSSWQGDWHHLAFVKDEDADKMYIYLDGDLGWWKPGVDPTVTNLADQTVRIGARETVGADYEGRMDDFRIYDIALSETDIEKLVRGGDLASAWGPNPYDGQADAPRDANLAWNAGNYADSHDVYFGTDYIAVRDANTSVTYGVFRGNTTDTVNDIEILDLDTWY